MDMDTIAQTLKSKYLSMIHGFSTISTCVQDVLFTSVSQDAMSPRCMHDTSSSLHICEAADQIKGVLVACLFESAAVLRPGCLSDQGKFVKEEFLNPFQKKKRAAWKSNRCTIQRSYASFCTCTPLRIIRIESVKTQVNEKDVNILRQIILGKYSRSYVKF